ncbi:MAG: aspartyl/glutamyl-tRNA amidotransferase subunit A [Anaerolineales bacterium]|nr:aspartyl/glutamyl-tRNA amidotransferase subunit A [Anaerolineales bacterium]MCX7755848.1 aspartyl/glutamyl-tRNA amidotransferase subunit A [Anaerolineales bacterium]MDW8277457.1 amidase family protein [Anaerolineales bacterium]
MSLHTLTALEIARQVRAREVSASEVLEAHLAHIARVDGLPGRLGGDPNAEPDKVHAFITLTADRARKQAAAIDAKIAAGEDPGPLAGVPVTVKDIFCVEGTPSTAASKILANFTAPYTATPVARWEAAGAVVLGKVNLDEFTFGSSNESSAFQPVPRNPWNPNHVAGGSSGGSAAAVAALEGPISLGTDTAGSIRLPAAYCGVVGLKPTYGRVSRYGLIAFGSSLDCPGPLTRTVADSALALGAMAGPDPHDSTAATVPVPDYLAEMEKGVHGLKIGLSPDYFRITYFDSKTGELVEQPVPEVIKQSVLEAAQKLAQAGAEIIENVPMPHTRYGIPAYFVISRVEAASNLHRYDGVKYGYRTPDSVEDLRTLYRKSRGQGFGLQPKLRILMGMYVSAAQYSEQYYARALKIRSLIRRDFDQAFHSVDVLLTPSTPTAAFPIGGVYGDSVLMQYADQLLVTANHAGVPGISIPAGFDESGLPIGIHFFAPDFREDLLFRAGYAYEQATVQEAWRNRNPAMLSNS